MSSEPLAVSLSRVELFHGLAPERLVRIVREAERIVFRDGQRIITEDQEGDAAFVVVAGTAWRISGPGLEQPEQVPVGALIGEFAMLIEHVHSATVVAKGPVRVLKITRETLHRLLLDDQDLADHLVSRVSSRLARLATELRAVCPGDGEADAAYGRSGHGRLGAEGAGALH